MSFLWENVSQPSNALLLSVDLFTATPALPQLKKLPAELNCSVGRICCCTVNKIDILH